MQSNINDHWLIKASKNREKIDVVILGKLIQESYDKNFPQQKLIS